jgi:hypothetical protein
MELMLRERDEFVGEGDIGEGREEVSVEGLPVHPVFLLFRLLH